MFHCILKQTTAQKYFLIDWSKLGHSFWSNTDNSIYVINTKSSKLSSSSSKNAKSFSIWEELVPTWSSKIKLPHIQSSQFLETDHWLKNDVLYYPCVTPIQKISKSPIVSLMKFSKKSVKKRLAQTHLFKEKKAINNLLIKIPKPEELDN